VSQISITETPGPANPYKASFLTAGFSIACASGLAYMIVYAYDLGFCLYFAIPLFVISISTPNLIAVALVILLLFYTSPILLAFIPAHFLRDFKDDWYIFPLLLIVTVALVFGQVIGLSLFAAVAAWLVVAVLWLIVLLTLGLARSGRIRRKAKSSLPTIDHLAQFMSRETAINIFGIGLAILLITCLANFAGFMAARTQDMFPIADERMPRVILVVYGDTAVAADFDAATRTVTPSFTFYSVSRTLPRVTVEQTGTLKSTCTQSVGFLVTKPRCSAPLLQHARTNTSGRPAHDFRHTARQRKGRQ